jgi:protocatechuate 3,4-dioxygenase beta subunit
MLTIIPGPAFQLLTALDRHSMRPAHMHTMVTADGYQKLVTQLFPKDDPWLETDTVFATKDDLACDFTPIKGHPEAELELKFNFTLVPASAPKATLT